MYDMYDVYMICMMCTSIDVITAYEWVTQEVGQTGPVYCFLSASPSSSDALLEQYLSHYLIEMLRSVMVLVAATCLLYRTEEFCVLTV